MFDLRDIAREWQDTFDELVAASEEGDAVTVADITEELSKFTDLCDELGIEQSVEALTACADNEPTLIPEDEFEDYAQKYLENTTEIPEFLYGYIDWKRWASDLAMDFSTITYDGQTYYVPNW